MQKIAIAIGIFIAVPAMAAPLAFDYTGKALLDIQRRVVKTEMVTRNIEVITGTGLEGPKVAWVLHQDEIIQATIAVWPADCQAMVAPGAPYSKERRGSQTLTMVRDSGATFIQAGSHCWVAYGDRVAYQPLLDAVTQIEPDQAFPHRDKPVELVQSLAVLRETLHAPFVTGPRPTWKGLAAGQAVTTPEQGAQRLGFSGVKIAPRQAAYGTGYLLSCGDNRSKGQMAAVVLSADGLVVRQFSALVPNERVRDELARLTQELGEPASEEKAAGQLKYRWFNQDYQTVLQQMPEGDWLFQWRPSKPPMHR